MTETFSMKEINIIYTAQADPAHVTYSNDIGKVWFSSNYKQNMPNIAMNSYSAVKIGPNDGLFIAEPICVLEQNYNIDFVNKFKHIFTWATKVFTDTKVENKITYVNFPSYRNNPLITMDNWLNWNDRKNEIVFIANNKNSPHHTELYSLRIKLADWFHANSNLTVSWYGNMPVRRSYYKGNVNCKADILTKVKFCVCSENSYDQVYSANFLTEKLPDVWLSGAVPVYAGCSNMDELGISENNYINLLPYINDFSGLNDKLNSFSEDDYTKMTDSYCKLNSELYRLTAYENMFDIMLNTY